MPVRNYELMAVLSPDVSEEDLPAAIEQIAGHIAAAGGTVTSTHRDSPWGRRRLAYPIRHNGRDVRDGYFVLYYMDLESPKVVELERELKLNDRVIRHLIAQQVAPAPVPEPPAEAVEGETEPAPAGTVEVAAPEAPAALAAEAVEPAPAASDAADSGAEPVEVEA